MLKYNGVKSSGQISHHLRPLLGIGFEFLQPELAATCLQSSVFFLCSRQKCCVGGRGGGGVRSVSVLVVYQICSVRSEKPVLHSYRVHIQGYFVRKDRRSRVMGKKVLIYDSTIRSWGLPLFETTKIRVGFSVYTISISGLWKGTICPVFCAVVDSSFSAEEWSKLDNIIPADTRPIY